MARFNALCMVLPLLAACADPAPFSSFVRVENPTALTFTGSGGALGVGVEIRAGTLEGGEALVLDAHCQGRRCGEPAETDPGRCGVPSQVLEAGSAAALHWDGRYFPRGVDIFGPCLGAARAVTTQDVRVTLCGRLGGDGVRLAELRCKDVVVPLTDEGFNLTVTVPGAPLVP